jgi:hypothetical protein
MNITTNDGRAFTGTALQIVQAMKSIAFNGTGSLADYIDWVIDNTQRFNDVELNVTGETDEARAESLLAEMVRVGLAKQS